MKQICKNCGHREDEHTKEMCAVFNCKCKKFEAEVVHKDCDFCNRHKPQKGCGGYWMNNGIKSKKVCKEGQLCPKCKPQRDRETESLFIESLKPQNHSPSSHYEQKDMPKDSNEPVVVPFGTNSQQEEGSATSDKNGGKLAGTFNLSEKIFRFEGGARRGGRRQWKGKIDLYGQSQAHESRLKVKDVKEFIERLHEFVWDRNGNYVQQINEFFNYLDKLAGKELVK